MKRYRFVGKSPLPEFVIRDPVVLELVSKMDPNDVMAALVTNLGLRPEDAAQATGALMQNASRAQKAESFGMDGVPMTMLYPDEEEEDDEWPYDAATKGVMNSPLAAGPRMTT